MPPTTDTSGVGGKQLVTITPEIALNPVVEILLAFVAILLFAGSGEMFVHERLMRFWKRIREA